MAYKGKYKPNRPDKYQGDPTKITYRSLWERKCMRVFDENPNVISWQSEEICIPYVSPVDGKRHRYYPDFLIELRNKTGEIETLLIEVKPSKQTVEPKKPASGRVTRRYLNEVKTYVVNDAKWKAAKQACDEKGWVFRILTEKEIF
tara:strand:- start:3669 stop:4106 length:438 start_codon:yes stop_codon:yes gene_type:complete